MSDSATPRPRAKRPWLAAVLSALIPGAGQLYLGRILRALAWFAPALLLGAVAIVAFRMRTTDLIGTALEPRVLWSVFWANLFAAAWRVGAALDAWVSARRTTDRTQRLPIPTPVAVVGWLALVGFVLVPHLFVGQYSYDAVTLVEEVFVAAGEEPGEPIIPIGPDADIVPDPVVSEYEGTALDPLSSRNMIFREGLGDPGAVDAWPEVAELRISGPSTAPFLDFNERVGGGRITVLVAGGDSGPDRGGLRTDSMMVATIDTNTGKAALFSFPRNMGSIPLPSRFSSAFIELEKRLAPEPEPVEVEEGEEPPPPPEFESCECFPEQLNALYPFTRRWTGTYPDEPDPGMAALRDTLSHLMGVKIDYYALVDMAAFVDLVDAIGGIDVYALEPMESEVSPPREGDPWAYVNIDVGWNHLDGMEALAYARARKGSSDYARMARQRCLVKATAAKADPVTIVRSFPDIVDAITGSVVTDIPLTFVPDLLEAVAGMDFDDIETVGFTHNYWEPERDHLSHPIPNVDRIRWKTNQVFSGQSDPGGGFEVSTECEV